MPSTQTTANIHTYEESKSKFGTPPHSTPQWDSELDRKFVHKTRSRDFAKDKILCFSEGKEIKDFIHSTVIPQTKKEVLESERMRRNIGMLRQWLNEDRKCTPLVTNEDIKYWLTLNEE